ncbi:MAG: hypothetical protein WC637_00245 [Victivallales bacterium]|jgi:hypothetical protein
MGGMTWAWFFFGFTAGVLSVVAALILYIAKETVFYGRKGRGL